MTTFRIGHATVTAIPEIVDTSFKLRSFFPASTAEAVAAEAHWLSPRFHDATTDSIRLSIHAWLVNTGRNLILIDTCVGNHKHRPARSQWNRLETPFLQRLAAVGLHPEQIDYVCCTHLHADHVGWNTRLLDGRWVPTFPNAKYVFGQREYDHWDGLWRMGDPSSHHLAAYADSVLPVIEAGKVLLASDGFILDGCLRFEPAPGHTPGHVAIRLSSNGQSCVFSGDILHHPVQLRHPAWSCMGCDNQAEAARTRIALLDDLAETDTCLMTGHFLAPHAGRVTEFAGGFWLSTLN